MPQRVHTSHLDVGGHKAELLQPGREVLELGEHEIAVVPQRGQAEAPQVPQQAHLLHTAHTSPAVP